MLRRLFLALVPALALSACGLNQDPTDPAADAPDSQTITIGTANFPESEIIGQLWAGVLEEEGFDVEVKSGIGSREVYMQALESGEVDIVPEYTGNLAQFYDADLTAGADADEVYAQLSDALPDNLKAAVKAPAESKDSFSVTAEVAREEGLKTIGDLAKLDKVVLAANPEISERPYGPKGLEEIYGVDGVELKPISDSGGPLTIAALTSGEATVADIYTTSPVLDKEGNEVDVVRLDDPKNLVAAQNVVPIYSPEAVSEDAVAALDEFDAQLRSEDLVEMNLRNVGAEKAEPAVIAKDFLDQR